MNSKEIQSLAKRLAANPNFIREVEEDTIHDLLLDYTAGLLDPNVEQEVRELIANDPLVAMIWKNFNAVDIRLRSPDGQRWMEEAGERILSNVLASRANEVVRTSAKPTRKEPKIHVLSSLRDSICELFLSRASLATASGNEGMERTLKDGKTRIVLKPDSAGRLWLQVTSTAEEFAGKTFQVGVQPTPALLSFSEVSPGVHDACVCVSDELAAALTSGAELKLTPFPQS